MAVGQVGFKDQRKVLYCIVWHIIWSATDFAVGEAHTC